MLLRNRYWSLHTTHVIHIKASAPLPRFPCPFAALQPRSFDLQQPLFITDCASHRCSAKGSQLLGFFSAELGKTSDLRRKGLRSCNCWKTIIHNYTLTRMRLQKLMSRLTTIKNDINGSYNFKRRFFFSCAVHMKLIHGKGMKGIQGDQFLWMDSLKPNKCAVRIHLSC